MTISQTHTRHGLIEYRITGEGPTLLILNGGHTSCTSPLGHEHFFLSQGYRLLIPSRPGYGKTPSSTGKTAASFADALVSLLDVLHIDTVMVVGISAGGPTALQLAGRHPDRVTRLMLQQAVTGRPFPTGLTRIGTYLVFNRWIEAGTWAAFRTFGRMAPQAALKTMLKSLSTLDPDQILKAMSPEQQQAMLRFLLACRSGSGFLHDIHHQCGDLHRIVAPTLIITSRYDGSIDASHGHYAATHIPHATSFVSEAESHLLWFSSHNAKVEEAMRDFFASWNI